jgi:2-polyprenyl-3-methyl-5-hydroxy-6-metoxy-1,4-benzoquinol methylase
VLLVISVLEVGAGGGSIETSLACLKREKFFLRGNGLKSNILAICLLKIIQMAIRKEYAQYILRYI